MTFSNHGKGSSFAGKTTRQHRNSLHALLRNLLLRPLWPRFLTFSRVFLQLLSTCFIAFLRCSRFLVHVMMVPPGVSRYSGAC